MNLILFTDLFLAFKVIILFEIIIDSIGLKP